MTTITLEVPEELAVKLAPLYHQLPELLSIAVELAETSTSSGPTNSEAVYPVFKEVVDFLISRPTPQQIISFKVSSSVQTRLEELLDRNREGDLTGDEAVELDTYEQINHLLILLKARAHHTLASSHR
jgi:hypothetical protein